MSEQDKHVSEEMTQDEEYKALRRYYYIGEQIASLKSGEIRDIQWNYSLAILLAKRGISTPTDAQIKELANFIKCYNNTNNVRLKPAMDAAVDIWNEYKRNPSKGIRKTIIKLYPDLVDLEEMIKRANSNGFYHGSYTNAVSGVIPWDKSYILTTPVVNFYPVKNNWWFRRLTHDVLGILMMVFRAPFVLGKIVCRNCWSWLQL